MKSTVLASMVVMAGCATIISGTRQEVRVLSHPSGATVVVEPGAYRAVTPGSVDLTRKTSGYRVTFDKPGFDPTTVSIHVEDNPWALPSVFFGVLPLLLDMVTGASNRLEPSMIEVELTPSPDAVGTSEGIK